MKVRDVEWLTRVSKIMCQDSCRANKFADLTSFNESNHVIKDLPHPERKQPTMLRFNRLPCQNIGDCTVETIPLVWVDELLILG